MPTTRERGSRGCSACSVSTCSWERPCRILSVNRKCTDTPVIFTSRKVRDLAVVPLGSLQWSTFCRFWQCATLTPPGPELNHPHSDGFSFEVFLHRNVHDGKLQQVALRSINMVCLLLLSSTARMVALSSEQALSSCGSPDLAHRGLCIDERQIYCVGDFRFEIWSASCSPRIISGDPFNWF